jgi:hypothetical protein
MASRARPAGCSCRLRYKDLAVPGKQIAVPACVPTSARQALLHANFTAGRQGNLAIDDEYASSHHARFQVESGKPS